MARWFKEGATRNHERKHRQFRVVTGLFGLHARGATTGTAVASTRVMSKAFVLGIAAYTLCACTVQGRTRAYVEPVSTVEVTSAPVVTYDAYPSTVYEGRTVYYIDNRWGYPRGDRWVYYRAEPPPLARYRTRVQAAPPAPRRYAPPTSAPPAIRAR